MLARRVLPVLLALVAASGCRALNSGSLARGPERLGPRTALPVAELVERHNRNAELVTSLRANPSVNVHTDGHHYAVRGRLALERPRSFRMQLESTLRQEVDLGSNEEELWVWSGRSKEKAIYVCKYDENGELPDELMFQPDWIIEGLGLRRIPDVETRQIREEATKDPRFVVLVHRRTRGNGQTVLKKTVVEKSTGSIREHHFYAADGKSVLASVQIQEPRRYALSAQAGGEPATVELPSKLRLWSQPPGLPGFEMTLTLEDLQVNPTFSPEFRSEIFAVPHIADTQIVDVREQLGPRRGSAAVRETRPVPPGGSGVRLGEPIPLDEDVPARSTDGPVPLGAGLGTSSGGGLRTLVGRPYPHPSADDANLAAEAGRLSQVPPLLER